MKDDALTPYFGEGRLTTTTPAGRVPITRYRCVTACEDCELEPCFNGPSIYGYVCKGQFKLLKREVAGAIVYDLGAGRGLLASVAYELRAAHVTAVDYRCDEPAGFKGEWHEGEFEDLADDLPRELQRRKEALGATTSVAIVSWPEPDGAFGLGSENLEMILPFFDRVVYRGKNHEGVRCGSAGLWKHLLTREPEHEVRHRTGSCVVYGGPRHTPALAAEERDVLALERAHLERETWASVLKRLTGETKTV